MVSDLETVNYKYFMTNNFKFNPILIAIIIVQRIDKMFKIKNYELRKSDCLIVVN